MTGGGLPDYGPPPTSRKVAPTSPPQQPPPASRRHSPAPPSPKKVSAQKSISCSHYATLEDYVTTDLSPSWEFSSESSSMTEMDINSDWSESGVSINTAAMRDMLPSISSDVQIVEIEERELDTQSVCQAAEDLLGKVSKDDFAPINVPSSDSIKMSKDDFAPINVPSSDSIKKNMSASCPPPYPPPLSILPSSLTLKTEPNVYCPPVLHPNALSPPSKEPTVARSIPPRALRRGPPVEAATPTGLIKETAPLPPRPPDESPLTGDSPSNAQLARHFFITRFVLRIELPFLNKKRLELLLHNIYR